MNVVSHHVTESSSQSHIINILICRCQPLQDVANETNDICDTSVSKNKIVVTYGQSIHLGCFETVPEILRDQQVSWYHHSKDNGR